MGGSGNAQRPDDRAQSILRCPAHCHGRLGHGRGCQSACVTDTFENILNVRCKFNVTGPIPFIRTPNFSTIDARYQSLTTLGVRSRTGQRAERHVGMVSARAVPVSVSARLVPVIVAMPKCPFDLPLPAKLAEYAPLIYARVGPACRERAIDAPRTTRPARTPVSKKRRRRRLTEPSSKRTSFSVRCQTVGRPPSDAARRPGEESPGSTGTRCRLTAGGGDPRDSATESKPPDRRLRAGRRVRVKGCGKSAPRGR